MKQFDLSVYKSSQPYFDLFDVYFKEHEIRKENYLIDNGITPSTYRQCRKGRYNMGFKIIKTLGKKFSLKVPSNEEIDQIKKILNDIYFDMYYQNYKLYDFYIEKIDELLNQKSLFFQY